MKKMFWMACLALSVLAWIGSAGAELEYKVMKKVDLPTAPKDVAVSPNEKFYYVLTQGSVLVFSVQENKVVYAIPVGEGAEKIVHAPESDLLIVADAKEKNFQVIRMDMIRHFDLEGSPYVGSADAPVTVVIFNHYQCPYCAKLDPKIQELTNLFGANIRVVYKSYPPYNDIARKASSAAVAAYRQGKFWEMHHALHEIEMPLDEEKIASAAASVGLDIEKFKADLEDPKTMAIVERDVKEGIAADVDAVPYFFVNGRHLKNEDLNSIYQRIQEEIEKSVLKKASDEKETEWKRTPAN